MKPLESVIREATEHFERKWAEEAARAAELRETPEGTRMVEAKALLRARLPPFVLEPKETLLPRVHPDYLRAINAWTWEQNSLVLCGPTEQGKTTAAALLVRRLFAAGVRHGGRDWEVAKGIAWHHASSLSRARKRHALGEDEAPEVVEAMRASLLVLDDVSWANDNEVIGDVLNARYEAKRPTVVTSGVTVEQQQQQLGDAVLRRILQAGGRGQIVSTWPEPEGKKSARKP